MFQTIRNFGSKIVASSKALYSQALLSSIVATNVVLDRGGTGKGLDIGSLGCTIQDLAFKVAFYGAIVGLMLYGVYKVISIINPQLAGSVSNYVKDVFYGLIIVAVAGAVVSFLGGILFGEGFGSGALCG